MIKIDYKYVDGVLNQEKDDVLEKLNNSNMTGWLRIPSAFEISEIKRISQKIKENADCLVVIGIGGSFLGSCAAMKMLDRYFESDKFEVIYAGCNLSSKYLEELLEYLEDKNFSVNVISKSGSTMEVIIAYNLIKELMQKKYTQEELKKHIIITTDKENGLLRKEALEEGYDSLEIADDIGGRYSFITGAHLLPLALNYDIDSIIKGYEVGLSLKDAAYKYAVVRKSLFDMQKYVENFSAYEENMQYFLEWIKQLFGETEGKDGKGILPMSTIGTRDLHSLGQFIQEGNKIIFETFIKVKNSKSLKYNKQNLHTINNVVIDSVRYAHYMGKVYNICIEIDKIDEENIGELMAFLMLSAAFSGYLFGIDPFNQPGVEVYKKEVKEALAQLGV